MTLSFPRGQYAIVYGSTGGPAGDGISKIIPVDYSQNPFNASIFVTIASGSATYSVQATGDNIQNSAITPNWFTHQALVTQTTSQADNYAFPVTAVRLQVTAGSGEVIIEVLQAGITSNG